MDKTPITLKEIYTSRKIILQLLKTQGYQVSEYENFSVGEIGIMMQNNQLDLILEKNPTNDNAEKDNSKIYIAYYLGKQLRPANVMNIIEDLFVLDTVLTKNDTLYIITKEEVNDTLLSEQRQQWESHGIFIVIESLKRLQFNILEHSLVPKHIKLHKNEIETLLKKYNINHINQLPEISRFDPVARAICLRPGEVCSIERPSKTSIESNYFRICIN